MRFNTPSLKGRFTRVLHTGPMLVPILLALAAHLWFSPMGFSPTDDGWVLAQSRRILAGQIPHRDFIILQPTGSEFLHAAEVAFGGEYTYWISRLIVWVQFAMIAWAWPLILSKLTRITISSLQRISLSVLCFLFTSSTFSILAWPTIDGLFLISMGLLLCLRSESWSKVLGYVLVGSAYVCKQNFAAVFPVAVILLGDWKKIRYWAAALLPGVAYLSYLQAHGAIPEFLAQVGGQRSLFEHGILSYLGWQMLIAAALGLGSAVLVLRQKGRLSNVGVALSYLVLLGAAVTLNSDLRWFSDHTAWVLFGLALGATLGMFLPGSVQWDVGRTGLLVLAVAWAVSISVGFNFPTLGCGLLVLFLVLVPRATTGTWFSWKRVSTASLVALLAVGLVSYALGRHQYIYRDRADAELTARLDGILPGGRLIRTNPNTYDFLEDLKLATQKANGMNFAIMPGVAGYWVSASQLNPLPMDWPLAEVMFDPRNLNHLIRELAGQKGKIVLIVEKVEPGKLSNGFQPLRERDYPPALLAYVRKNFQKVGETKFFEIRQ